MSLKYDSTILVDGDEPTNRALLDILKKINEVSAIADAARSTATAATVPPIGYVYTQGPDDMSPGDLWPTVTWENVSSEEAGSFRRYEGGAASDFGSGQQSDAFQGHWHILRQLLGGGGTGVQFTFASQTNTNLVTSHPGNIGDAATDGVNGTPRTSAETRPKNYTVRKWRRTA
jgi:hypothetical protein